jgi:hypothetical protein
MMDLRPRWQMFGRDHSRWLPKHIADGERVLVQYDSGICLNWLECARFDLRFSSSSGLRLGSRDAVRHDVRRERSDGAVACRHVLDRRDCGQPQLQLCDVKVGGKAGGRPATLVRVSWWSGILEGPCRPMVHARQMLRRLTACQEDLMVEGGCCAGASLRALGRCGVMPSPAGGAVA